MPWAVFTDPEISWVGMTDAEAKAAGFTTVLGKFPFAASGRAMAVRETDGFCKVVADKKTHRILGAGFVGAPRVPTAAAGKGDDEHQSQREK